MTHYALILAATSLVACNGGKDDTGDDAGPAACEAAQVKSTVPTDGATDAYYRMDIEFVLDKPDDTATFSVTDAAGGALSGTQSTSSDGKTVYFSPDSPLASSATYSATLDACFGSPSIEFTTNSLGTMPDCEVVGRTYEVALASARFVEPAALGELIGEYLEESVLVGVVSQEGDGLQMLGAVAGDNGGQDFCNPSIDFPDAADYSEPPYFVVGPDNTILSVAGYEIAINSLMISGSFASDCSYFGGGVLAGELDARDLGELVKPLVGTDDPDELCALLSGFGVACSECAGDGAPYCVTLRADQILADEMDGLVLECVATEDCHEQCDSVGKECDVENYPVCE